jgi:uncharacterized protein (DUF2164 family)
MIIESKLVDRLTEKLKAEDERAVEMMAGGNIVDFAAYRYSAGYRKALADCKILLDETYKDLLEE